MKKIAIITGGSRGIGKEVVKKLLEKNIHVVFTYHSNKEAADSLIEELGKNTNQQAHATFLKLDTRNISSFKAFSEQLSALLKEKFGTSAFDFLINNAGTGIYKPFLETSEQDFDEMFNIHIKGVYFLTQILLKHMNDFGRIINLSTGLARFTLPGSSAYAASKGAVEVFTKYLAKEMSHRKITANVVAPGAVSTDFGGGTNKTNQEKRAVISKNTALGRVAEVEDIGGIIAMLCQEDSQWINGQRIEATGGFML